MYQIVTIILPVITIPYLSRVLGPSGLGEYSLTNAYAQYFILFGMIGWSIYCSREVAYVKDEKEELCKVFWELNILRFITMGISIILYIIVFLFIIKSNNKELYIIQGLFLLSSLVDISWLFIGLEEFKKIALRNTIVKILGVIFIFIFIKNSSQVYLYALILGGTQFIGQIIMWIDVPNYIKYRKPRKFKLIEHLKISFKLFIPQISINIYTTLDKIMLGVLTNDIQVGLYDNSQKIIKILIAVVTTLATVTIPKMSNLYKHNKMEEFKENVYKSFSFVSFLAFPMTFGLMGVCETFVIWFYGVEFDGIKPMFYFGACIMIALSWSSILGSQVLISIKRDKIFTIAVTSGAILNIIFNFILINKFEGVGTTISSVVAEFTGVFIMVYYIRDILDIRKLFKCIPKYFFASLFMFIIVFYLGRFLHEDILGTLIQTIVGIMTYLIIMIIIKDDNIIYIFKVLRNKIKS